MAAVSSPDLAGTARGRSDQGGHQQPNRDASPGRGSMVGSLVLFALLNAGWIGGFSLRGATPTGATAASTSSVSRVIIAHDPLATDAFQPRADIVRRMAAQAITNLANTPTTRAAWRRLISTNDKVGIKVHSGPGAASGTRPAVAAALVEQLLDYGLPPSHVIIWDRQRADLRKAGYFELAEKYGVRVEGSVNSGYDAESFYQPDHPVIGTLIWSDLEFGKKGESVGRKSYFSKLVTREMTKIVVVTPLLNHNTAGVFGHLYSLAMGSVDNALRFEPDLLHLKNAVPEIYALPPLSDRVVLCVTDALVCQYEGEERGLLHYSTALNELRFSLDPVALDLLSLRELDRQRSLAPQRVPTRGSLESHRELLENAALLELGNCEDARIRVEHLR